MARGVVHEPFPSLNYHDHLWDRMSFLILRMRERLFTSINEVIRYVKKAYQESPALLFERAKRNMHERETRYSRKVAICSSAISYVIKCTLFG